MGLLDFIGNIVSGGIGAAYGIKQGEKQFERQKELMKDQYEYNEQAAENAQKRSYEMWLRTNYSAQRKQMEEAGLNPALMYGMSGGGGASSTGAQGAGASLPQDQSVTIEQNAQAMGMDLFSKISEALVNATEADKNKSEKENIEKDTEVKDTIKELNEAQKKLTNQLEKLNWQNTQNAAAEYRKLGFEASEAYESLRKAIVDADIAEATKKEQIKAFMNNNKKLEAEAQELWSRTGLNKKQQNYIQEKIDNYAYELETGRMTAEAAKENASNMADSIANDIYKFTESLSWREKEFIRDTIMQGLDRAVNIVDLIGKLRTLGLKDVAEEIIHTWKDRTGTYTTKTTTKGKQ